MASGEISSFGFLHRFLQVVSQSPQAVAIHQIDDDVRITYGQLLEKVQRCIGALECLGVQADCRVLLALPNSPSLVVAWLAAMGARAVAVLVSDKLTAFEFARLIDDAKPIAVITTSKLLDKHRDALDRCPGLRAAATVDALRVKPLSAPIATVELDAVNASAKPMLAPDGNPVVTIQYTYKGLGEPLRVAHRYLAFTHEIDGIHEYLHRQGVGSTFLVALPIYAIFGLAIMTAFPLSAGATMLMTNNLLKRDLADVLSRYRVTLACLVPELIRFFTERLKKRKTAVPPLHPELMIYSAGSYLPVEVGRELGQLLGGKAVLQGYGLTETMPILLQSTTRATMPGAIGQPISCVQTRIVDSMDRDVEDGQVGELIVRGPTVVDAYPNNARASKLLFRDGWFHTGDLVRREQGGHMFFAGNRLRIAKIAAQMVDLTEIEQVALKFPAVGRVRASVRRDAAACSQLRMTVDSHAPLDKDALRAHLMTNLSSFKVPRQID